MTKKAKTNKETEKNTNDNGKTPQDGDQKGGPFRIISHYVKDVSFENPGVKRMLTGEIAQSPEDNVNHNIQWNLAMNAIESRPNWHETEVKITITATLRDNVCFVIEVCMGAMVEINPAINEAAHIEQIMLIEIPRILYPYLRCEIDTMARGGGYPPLMVPPLDFAGSYIQSKKQQSEGAAQK